MSLRNSSLDALAPLLCQIFFLLPPNPPSLASSLPFPSFPSNFLSYVSHFSQGLEWMRLSHTMEGSLLRKGILLQSLFKCSTIVRIQRYHGILCRKGVNLL